MSRTWSMKAVVALTMAVAGAVAVDRAAAQQFGPGGPGGMGPGGPGGGYGSYYQAMAGAGGPGPGAMGPGAMGPGGPQMMPEAMGGCADGHCGGGEEEGGGTCPYCGGAGCESCGGQAAGYSGECGGGCADAMAPVACGFLDSAIPMTQIRVRGDHMTNFQDFDRALYYFPTTVANGGQLPQPEGVMDLDEITTIIEVAFTKRFSAFVELPARIIHSDDAPELNGGANRDGFGDMRGGGKFALIANECQYLTAQARVFVPTGNAEEALGVGHTSIEGGLLYWRKLGERLSLQAEVMDWVATNSPRIPGDGLFAGNVMKYGVGGGFDVINGCGRWPLKVTLTSEFIGWTVVSGEKSGPQGPTSANGDTIVNHYWGLRATEGPHSFFIGWGERITGAWWSKEDFRLEYAWQF